MPLMNRFQHQLYPTSPSIPPVLRTLTCEHPEPGSLHSLHTQLKIGRVILVHGTFLGDDPLGLAESLKSLGKGVPLLGAPLEKLAAIFQARTRPLAGSVLNDIANYTTEFRDTFQTLVGDDPQVQLLEPTWSSQNHHLARADLAVRLLEQLLTRPVPGDQRVLLWGHSHAGNAFALLSNLLANDRQSVAEFFEAAGEQTDPHWRLVREALRMSSSPHPLAKNVVIATFATPVRYGWDSSGYAQLVHLTFHRPHNPEKPALTAPLFPPQSVAEIVGAAWGDWVQAFAIAGTDVSSVPSMSANERLTKLLEANLPEPVHGLDTQFIPSKRLRNACVRWKAGTRCHTDGLNLLVDYVPCGRHTAIGEAIETTVMGHGVATTIAWLPSHLRLIVDALSGTLQ
jgi:hypothetical protein